MIPTVNHFLGQQDVIARFKVALEAAWNDADRLPHMLFVGPPGTGWRTGSRISLRGETTSRFSIPTAGLGSSQIRQFIFLLIQLCTDRFLVDLAR